MQKTTQRSPVRLLSQQMVEQSRCILFRAELKHPDMLLPRLICSSAAGSPGLVGAACWQKLRLLLHGSSSEGTPGSWAGLVLSAQPGCRAVHWGVWEPCRGGKQAGAAGTASVMGGGRSVWAEPGEGLPFLREVMSEFSHLWVGQQQALQSIVSVSLGIVSVGGFPAQNAELRVKQVFSPRKKKNSNNNLFFCSFFFFSCLIYILCSLRRRMLFLKEI